MPNASRVRRKGNRLIYYELAIRAGGRSPGPTVPSDHWPNTAFQAIFMPERYMFPLFILAVSSIALVRFAVSQWRAIWIASARQPLSDSLQLAAAGIDPAAIAAGDF